MTESPGTGENPHDDELDVEGPNESAPGHEPQENEPDAAQEGAPPGSNS